MAIYMSSEFREVCLFAYDLFHYLYTKRGMTDCMPYVGDRKDHKVSRFTEHEGKAVMFMWHERKHEIRSVLNNDYPYFVLNKENFQNYSKQTARKLAEDHPPYKCIILMSSFLLEMGAYVYERALYDYASDVTFIWFRIFNELTKVYFSEQWDWEKFHYQAVELGAKYDELMKDGTKEEGLVSSMSVLPEIVISGSTSQEKAGQNGKKFFHPIKQTRGWRDSIKSPSPPPTYHERDLSEPSEDLETGLQEDRAATKKTDDFEEKFLESLSLADSEGNFGGARPKQKDSSKPSVVQRVSADPTVVEHLTKRSEHLLSCRTEIKPTSDSALDIKEMKQQPETRGDVGKETSDPISAAVEQQISDPKPDSRKTPDRKQSISKKTPDSKSSAKEKRKTPDIKAGSKRTPQTEPKLSSQPTHELRPGRKSEEKKKIWRP